MEAYDMGYIAYFGGTPYVLNPMEPHQTEYRDWVDGWCAAAEDYNRDGVVEHPDDYLYEDGDVWYDNENP